jgi:ATP-binding protein involved in chromosome partitioning
MFEKVGIPILGIVENMAIHICSNCGPRRAHLRLRRRRAHVAGLRREFLGSLPLDIRIREQADSASRRWSSDPDGPIAAIYRDIARKVAARIARSPRTAPRVFPRSSSRTTRRA